jgi:DNA polymerase III delta subunit
VVNEDKDFTKAESSWDKVKEIVLNTSNILVVRYVKVNKTTKFYKRNKADMVEFPKLDDNILVKYIQKDLTSLSIENAEMLIQACSSDYGRILLEIDKIAQYNSIKSLKNENTAFKELYESGAIYSDIGDITFALTNAVIVGDLENAFLLLDKAKRSGEPALRICSILYTNFKNMLSLLCLGKDRSNASARTGIEPRIVGMMMRQLGAYNIKDCIRNVNICQRVETGVKNGTIDADVALDYLITSLLY